MVSLRNSFSILDYCIFAVTIIISLGIGIYYALSGGKQRTTSEYFVGDRRMAILPVAISLMVSFESSIMMLGYPAEFFRGFFFHSLLKRVKVAGTSPQIGASTGLVSRKQSQRVYVYGLQLLIGNIGFFISNVLSVIIVVPLIHPLRITSAYEYLHMRFDSRAVRTLGSFLGMTGYAAYMGIVLFGPAIALEGVTGLPQWVSIISVALASVIYTAIGGLKAVIWTDVFQSIVMFTGFFAVLIRGTMQVGGIQKTWEIAYDNGRVNMFNFDPDPTVRHTFWCLFFGSIIRGFGLVFNQSSVQRISSTPTVRDARRVLLLVAPGFFLSLSFAGIQGVIAYAYYNTLKCDPLKSKQITNPNQIIPLMVMDIFKGVPGMPGLFMASLFSASLSTLSSGLSSLSALFWTDIVKPHTAPISEFRATVISKISVFVFGGLAVFVAFMIALIGGTLIQITGSLLSAFGGPLSGLFMFGAFCPWGNSKGAFFGTALSVIVTFMFSIGQMTTKGSVKNTKLPSAPMDFCPANVAAQVASFVNGTIEGSMSMVNETAYNVTSAYVTTMETMTSPAAVPEPEGISRIFMLSYQWFGALGILQVLLYGTIISFCTGYKKPGEVDKKYLIPFWDSLMPFLPECMKKVLRCGYNSPGEEKSLPTNGGISYNKIDDAGQDVFNTEVMIDPANITTDVVNEVLNTKLDLNGVVPVEHHVMKSVDDLRVSSVPVKDMELVVIKNLYHNEGDEDRDPTYVVIDKVTMALKLQARSMEFEVQPVPDILITEAEVDEETKGDKDVEEDVEETDVSQVNGHNKKDELIPPSDETTDVRNDLGTEADAPDYETKPVTNGDENADDKGASCANDTDVAEALTIDREIHVGTHM